MEHSLCCFSGDIVRIRGYHETIAAKTCTLAAMLLKLEANSRNNSGRNVYFSGHIVKKLGANLLILQSPFDIFY